MAKPKKTERIILVYSIIGSDKVSTTQPLRTEGMNPVHFSYADYATFSTGAEVVKTQRGRYFIKNRGGDIAITDSPDGINGPIRRLTYRLSSKLEVEALSRKE